MSWIKKFFSKIKGEKRPSGWVSLAGRTPRKDAVLIASTEKEYVETVGGSIRENLMRERLIESTVNPRTALKITAPKISGVEYPDDYNDFQDYWDAYLYIPYVARAIDVKQFMIWQMGYDLESTDEGSKKHVEQFLAEIEADTVIREGTVYALIFGNMYWQVQKEGDKIKLRPLNPLKPVGVKLNDEGEITEYVYKPEWNKKPETFEPKEIVHLKFNALPGMIFGVSCLRRVLPTIKQLLYMEEKLPLIARRRADPLLEFQIGDFEHPVNPEVAEQIKNKILNRKPGEDIFHDGTIVKIEEVYKSPGIGARQAVEPLLKHFRENLVAGLGVPEIALGFGKTTTEATAWYQQELLDSEIRSYQRALKRLHENQLFKLIRTRSPVKLIWRPLKEEDKNELSKRFQGEIQHGIISPAYARQLLGYPEEAGEGAVINQNLVPSLEKPRKKGEK